MILGGIVLPIWLLSKFMDWMSGTDLDRKQLEEIRNRRHIKDTSDPITPPHSSIEDTMWDILVLPLHAADELSGSYLWNLVTGSLKNGWWQKNGKTDCSRHLDQRQGKQVHVNYFDSVFLESRHGNGWI